MVIVCGLDQTGVTGNGDRLALGPEVSEHANWGLLMPQRRSSYFAPCDRQTTHRKIQNQRTLRCLRCCRRVRKSPLRHQRRAKSQEPRHPFRRHLEIVLEEDWSDGDPDWYQEVEAVGRATNLVREACHYASTTAGQARALAAKARSEAGGPLQHPLRNRLRSPKPKSAKEVLLITAVVGEFIERLGSDIWPDLGDRRLRRLPSPSHPRGRPSSSSWRSSP